MKKDKLSNTSEAIVFNMRSVNEEMEKWLTRFEAKRRPLAIEDYEWNKIQPDLVDPEVNKCIILAALVESNPNAPAENLKRSAEVSGATWLKRFIDETWLPEETMHGRILRVCVIEYGMMPQKAVDEEIEKVRERDFTLGRNYTDLKAEIYGMTQELITKLFYGCLKSGTQDPILLKILGDLAAQEAFHYATYKKGALITVGQFPQRSREVVPVIGEFEMPGHIMAPKQQQDANGCAQRFGFPMDKFKHILLTDLANIVGDSRAAQAGLAYIAHDPDQPWYIRGLASVLSRANIPPVNGRIGRHAIRSTREKSLSSQTKRTIR